MAKKGAPGKGKSFSSGGMQKVPKNPKSQPTK